MNVAGMARGSWRLEQAEVTRLAWALAISLALHLLVFGGYYTGKRMRLWEHLHWPAWLQPIKTLVEKLSPKPIPIPKPKPREIPLVFVDVSPAQATPEPPKQAKYYSDKNSLAANPVIDNESDTPKMTGLQTDFPKTEDTPRDKYVPLQPSAPPQPVAPSEPAKQAQPEEKAKTTLAPGDLALAKPDPTPKTDNGEAPQHRPFRTLAEAQAAHHQTRPPGLQMKQDGGVHRRIDFSLDTMATPFGAYDAALIDAVRQCWYDELDHQKYAGDFAGKVVLQFDLHSDGRITGLRVADNNAGEIPGWLCQVAIDKPSPYAPFPPDMRRSIGESRHIQFTFYYY